MTVDVKETEVSIDAQGRVVINNETLKSRVQAIMDAKKKNNGKADVELLDVNIINCHEC